MSGNTLAGICQSNCTVLQNLVSARIYSTRFSNIHVGDDPSYSETALNLSFFA